MMYNLYVSEYFLPSVLKSELSFIPGNISLSIPGNGTKMLALCKFVRLIKQTTEVTYKPTLGRILTLPTRECSLKHVETENTQKDLAMDTQRSDSAIGRVLF
jgi:hypothetical protein